MWKLFRIFELIFNHFYSNILLRIIGIYCPFSSIIYYPLRIINSKNICIGQHVDIYKDGYIWINSADSKLVINDRTQIGAFSHICAMKKVIINKNVMIADKVFITDFNHEFNDINKPVRDQGISFIGNVEIGEDSWVGENVSIIGSNIGRHCVIGANSVVVKDIPDYSVAVGNPAQVIKKYDFNKKEWVRCL